MFNAKQRVTSNLKSTINIINIDIDIIILVLINIIAIVIVMIVFHVLVWLLVFVFFFAPKHKISRKNVGSKLFHATLYI